MFWNTPQAVLFVTCLGSSLFLTAGEATNKPDGKVEFRRAENQPAAGLVEAIVTGSDRKVYLYAQTEASNDDMKDIRVVLDDRGEPAMEITFTKDGAEKMARLTERHKGRPIALMIDGEVLSAPTVRAKFSTKALVTGKFTIDEVERIVRTIKNHR